MIQTEPPNSPSRRSIRASAILREARIPSGYMGVSRYQSRGDGTATFYQIWVRTAAPARYGLMKLTGARKQPSGPSHSLRSAVVASTRVARCAGPNVAQKITMSMTARTIG